MYISDFKRVKITFFFFFFFLLYILNVLYFLLKKTKMFKSSPILNLKKKYNLIFENLKLSYKVIFFSIFFLGQNFVGDNNNWLMAPFFFPYHLLKQ